MRLLLTSGGVRNQALADALCELASAPFAQLNVAFIPTAATIRDEDKGWLVDDLVNLRRLGWARFDIVELAALEPAQLMPRLERAQVLVCGGGSTNYLLGWVRARLGGGLARLLETRVLVGISAGSVMCCPAIDPSGTAGLHYVGFQFVPHLGSAFASRTREDVQGCATALGRTTYWADDDSGVLVSGDEVRVVGTGRVEVITP